VIPNESERLAFFYSRVFLLKSDQTATERQAGIEKIELGKESLFFCTLLCF
jgi:hypothetical protein